MKSLKNVCLVLCMAVVAACGGAPSEGAEASEGNAAPVTEAISQDTSAQGLPIPPGCGNFRQRCCEVNVCYGGLECDPTSRTCLY